MKTVDDLIEKMESAVPVGESTMVRLSVTDEPYIVHAFKTKDLGPESLLRMLEALYRCFKEQVIPNESKLYWRRKPEYSEHTIQTWNGQDIFDINASPPPDEIVETRWAVVSMRYLVSPGLPPSNVKEEGETTPELGQPSEAEKTILNWLETIPTGPDIDSPEDSDFPGVVVRAHGRLAPLGFAEVWYGWKAGFENDLEDSIVRWRYRPVVKVLKDKTEIWARYCLKPRHETFSLGVEVTDEAFNEGSKP